MNAREVHSIFRLLAKEIRAIQHRLDKLEVNRLLLYVEAAERLGIKERKLTGLVNDGSLIEGFHFIRIGSSVRFPADVAKRFYEKPPQSPTSSISSQEPCSAPPSPLPRIINETHHRVGTDTKSQFNLNY